MKPRWKDGYLVTDDDRTANEKAWDTAVRSSQVLEDVEARLVAAGAVTELRQLQGLSAQEQDVLVWLELHSDSHSDSHSCAPSTPHAPRAEVAA